jgi:hypothetical protein
MTSKFKLLLVPAAAVLCFAQEESTTGKSELALGLGGIPVLSRSNTPGLDAGAGVALQVNYGRQFLRVRKVAILGEVNFLASPQRDVSSSVATATRDFASLYLTPGIRVKLFPDSKFSPYALVGGGYADYEQSTTRVDGRPNPVSREIARGAFDFGAGVDLKVWRFIGLRGEARDYFTGSPIYNVATISGGQHNIAATGGIVLRWR